MSYNSLLMNNLKIMGIFKELLDDVKDIGNDFKDVFKDVGNDIYKFEFNYTKSTNYNDGYLINTPGGLFLFAGDRQEFPLISLAEETTIDDNEEPENESIDELDFSMF